MAVGWNFQEKGIERREVRKTEWYSLLTDIYTPSN
jgi:hypothetical protein